MEIPIKEEVERFYQHLNIHNNKNIIFSGIFGSGKTYFIQKFFKLNEEKYIPIIISPVNYAVASNEDIFEYLKVDILFQLMEKNPELEKMEFPFVKKLANYAINNPEKILIELLSKAGKLKYGTNIIDVLQKLYKKFSSELVKNIDEKKEVEGFMVEFKDKIGSIYEENAITGLIQSMINSLKGESSNNLEVVLVIDDLDRIDPEHIFRILNILSVHDNYIGCNEHKFDFDKVILVCDVENIKNIFKTKYGIDTDFNGYIDKFYSREIFHFYNIPNIIDNTMHLIKENMDRNSILSKHSAYIDGCQILLEAFVNNRAINLRRLLKFDGRRIHFNYSNRNDSAVMLHLPPNAVFFISFFKLFSLFFTTPNDLHSEIVLLKDSNFEGFDSARSIANLYSMVLPIATYKIHKFDNKYEKMISYGSIKFTLNRANISYVDPAIFTEEIANESVSKLIVDAYTNYQEHFSDY